MFMMIVVMQVMREEGLEQVTGLSCGTGDNQMVNRILSKQFILMIQCLSTSYPDNHQVVLHMLNKNDLVVCLDAPVGEDRVGELAAILATVRGSVVDYLTR